MWSQIAPELRALHLQGYVRTLTDVGQLTAALGGWFSSLTELSLTAFQFADERQVWADLGEVRSLRHLALRPWPSCYPPTPSLNPHILERSVVATGSFAQLLYLTLRLPLSHLPEKEAEWREVCQRLRERRPTWDVELLDEWSLNTSFGDRRQ